MLQNIQAMIRKQLEKRSLHVAGEFFLTYSNQCEKQYSNPTHRYRNDWQLMKDPPGNFFNLFLLRALSHNNESFEYMLSIFNTSRQISKIIFVLTVSTKWSLQFECHCILQDSIWYDSLFYVYQIN